MRQSFIRVTFISLILSSMPTLALAQVAAPATFLDLTHYLADIIQSLTAAAIGLGVVYFLYGVATSITDAGSAKGWEKFRGQILWGILALFLMFGIWQILRVLGNTLFGSNNFNSM